MVAEDMQANGPKGCDAGEPAWADIVNRSSENCGADEETALRHKCPEGFELCLTVLHTSPGAPNMGPEAYTNVTPWITKLFFVHTYYAYIYTFYMFMLAFYKGYALEYTTFRRIGEMVCIVVLPVLQHLRFFFGYWGNELGMIYDLCIFVMLSGVTMLVLMFFLFLQAYIMPFDSTFLFIAVVVVAVEGVCGAINTLQTVKLQTTTCFQIMMVAASITGLLTAISLFIVRELLPRETVVEEGRWETRA
mmetsp:Transcript_106017/g.310050  ORF Transcript_106017/g.310050 Transcript_106017/m.310050 type:complete len:248 (-) Transcript_106017:86-829(-)